MKLEFRAKLPDGKWFYQNNQYINSFFRRVLTQWQCTHESYLKEPLENKLQIKINGKWVQCEEPIYDEKLDFTKEVA